MAKIKPGIITIRGKMDDKVLAAGNKIKPYIRKAPGSGTKKHEPAFRKQYRRAVFLNNLASELNNVFKKHAPRLKHESFYHKLLKRFRREPLNNRFLLLMQTKGMELHPKHTFDSLGHCQVRVNIVKNKLVAELQSTAHPSPGMYKANSYYYEVLLLSWDKSDKPPDIICQYSDWIDIKEDEPVFEFDFLLRKGTKHWLISLRQQLGINKKKIESVKTEGMQIVEVGSLDKSDSEILKKREEEQKKNAVKKKEEEEPVRVKAKKPLK